MRRASLWFLPSALMLLTVPGLCSLWNEGVDRPSPVVSTATEAPAEEATPDVGVSALPRPAATQRDWHLSHLGVDRWHSQGFKGQGITIAVLDSGFRGYRGFLGKGLPDQIVTRSFRKDGNLEARDSQHGILCAEVLHSLAPQAKILMANWEPEDSTAFLEAVRWARQQGARIVSCSLIMPSWSDGEGGGPVHAALNRILGTGEKTGDGLCFASAGNTAQRHWYGEFNPDEAGLHQWSKGKTRNGLKPWGSERVAVELYGCVKGACEVEVQDAQTGQTVGRSALKKAGDASSAWGTAVVRFNPDPSRSYEVRVRGEKGKACDDRFHLVILGGSLSKHTSRGSIPFPGDGPRVSAVGAVDADGQRLYYSSCGPNSKEPKPDLVAVVPFPSMCRERPFAGTSAAAPQAAALAALVWSRFPDWTAEQVRLNLHKNARDLGPMGHDCETGHGLVRLP